MAGDERTFDVNYPEDAQDKRLAGKTFSYAVKVQAIKQKSLPELNDEFAKQLGEFQTVDDVRKAIREQMESERKHEAEHAAKEKLVAELIQRNDFEVPESLIEQQIDIRLERGLRALAAQGLTAEQMKKMDLTPPARGTARAGGPRCKSGAAARKSGGGREHAGQRRGAESGTGSAGKTIKTDV